MTIIYLNKDKVKRAEDLYKILSKNPLTEGETEQKVRYTQLLAEADISLTDKNKCVDFIYRKLGGALRTEEEDIKVRAQAKKRAKKFSEVEKGEEE